MKTPEEIKKGLKHCLANGTCYVCPYDDMTKDCDVCRSRLVADVEAYIQLLEAQTHRWIPVEERLPEDGQGALVICRDGYITTMAYEYERWWWQGTEDESVTNWMPLPEPPKKEDKK